MRQGDNAYFEHPLVRQMFTSNEQFYYQIAMGNCPIERLVGRPNRKKEDVIKVLAFGILGDKDHVVHLLNNYHFGWREAF